MRPSFQVTDRHLDLNRSYMLEASAGTGKTYSIENIVVRLLIASDPIPLSEILIVTFTQAATRDLKSRIRSNLAKAISHLERNHESAPDYLQAVIEKGEAARAKKQLEEALYAFDEAQIFTIHGFCSRMLSDHLFEGGISLQSIQEIGSFPLSTQIRIVDDFFRTEVKESLIHSEQFNILQGKFQNEIDKLKRNLISLLNKGLKIVPGIPFAENLSLFREQMKELKGNFNITKEMVLEDFEQLKKYYKKIDHEELKAERFAELFDKEHWEGDDLAVLIKDGYLWEEKSQEENRRARVPSQPLSLHYPDLVHVFTPIISAASNPANIMACFAHACQNYMIKFIEEEEILGFDDLLKAMSQAVKNPSFADRVKSNYQAAIIDEFQDTDPLQWDIFKTLFHDSSNKEIRLFLVGDPKQSIYSFRQADIYTYLSAAEAIGTEAHYSLNTNFRSQPELIHSLNALFDAQFAPGLIALPRENRALEYEPVKPGVKSSAHPFQDEKGAFHFLTIENGMGQDYEKEILFPYIANEIVILSRQGIKLRQCALLVNNRYQADTLVEVLKEWNIPVANQRESSLAKSPAVQAYLDLLKAIQNPRHQSRLRIALGGMIFNWTNEQILLLEELFNREAILLKLNALQRTLNDKGIASFFQELMKTSFQDVTKSLAEEILTREQGNLLYQDLLQLTELLAEEQCRYYTSLDGLIDYLENLMNEEGEEHSLKRRIDPSQDAVHVLTIHKSKGLEFDIVFTLGLIGKPPTPDKLIPKAEKEGLFSLHAVDENSDDYLNYCEELDAEKIRQLYVAFTRAKLRVYAPILFSKSKKLEWGSASPMELYAARMNQPFASYAEVYERIKNNSIATFESSLEKIGIPFTRLTKFLAPLQPYFHPSVIELIPPKKVSIPDRKECIYSYTALTRDSHKGEPLLNPIQSPPHDFFTNDKTVHTLPSGSEIGILLHKILEQIPLKTINQKDLTLFLQSYLQSTPYEEWGEVIGNIISNTLNTPLPLGNEKKSLATIALKNFYREIEFLYPWEETFNVPDVENQKGYLKGVIDLIFEYQQKYYLLDWKSNWLGPAYVDYSQENLHQSMGSNNYFLQAKVYREALRRYVKLFDDRPFEQVYGGTFYLFLRGLDGSEQGNGIYFTREGS